MKKTISFYKTYIVDSEKFEESAIPFAIKAYILGLTSDVTKLTKKDVDIAAQDLIAMWTFVSKNHLNNQYVQFRSNIDEIIDIVRKSRQVIIDKINERQKPVATEEFVLLDN